MDFDYLIQNAASATAILVLAGLAWRFGVARNSGAFDETRARALLTQEFPHVAFAAVWVAPNGRAAVGRSGEEAFILYALGDGHLARTLPWAVLASSEAVGHKASERRVLVNLPDRTAPRAAFALEKETVWPPLLSG